MRAWSLKEQGREQMPTPRLRDIGIQHGEAFHEVLGRDDISDDFWAIQSGDGWHFFYAPLGIERGALEVGALLNEEAVKMWGDAEWNRWEFGRRLRALLRSICEVDGLRVMQIAQVGI